MKKLPTLPPDFSRDELWSLVRELGIALMEAEQQIAQLREEIARQGANPQPSTPPKTSQNSSLPPSRDRKAKVSTKPQNKRGGKTGHAGKTRPAQDPAQIVECVASVCPRCGDDLSDVPRHLIQTHQVVDIPPIQPIVYEIRQYQHHYTCGACVPARVLLSYERNGFGPNLHALLSYFNGSHHIAHDRLGQMMQDMFGLHISAGAICTSLQRTAKRLIRPAYDTRLPLLAA